MNRKIISFAIAFLLCVGLCSAGFAAWVITGSTAAEEGGDILVDTVSDKRFDITVTSNDLKVVYGWKKDGISNDRQWLKNDTVETKEHLVITLTVKAVTKDKKEAATVPNLTLSDVKLVEGSVGQHATAVSNGLVGKLPTNASGIEKSDINDSNKTNGEYSWTVTITFTWGSKFGNKNPYLYYNEQDYKPELGEDAKTNLTNLETYLTGVKYQITATVK